VHESIPLTVENLPLLGQRFRINLQRCVMERNKEHGQIYTCIGQCIRYQNTQDVPVIYVVLNEHRSIVVAICVAAESRINILRQKIESTMNSDINSDFFQQLARLYQEEAETLAKKHYLLALSEWHKAADSYIISSKLRQLKPNQIIQLSRCYLMLGHLKKARSLLLKIGEEKEDGENRIS
jgi:hypothetical protein